MKYISTTLLIIFLLLDNYSFALDSNTVFKATKAAKSVVSAEQDISRATKITSSGVLIKNLSIHDCKVLSKSENITAILNKGVDEKFIKYKDTQYFLGKFNEIADGDILLLKCLQHSGCNIDNYLDIIKKSDLHKTVISKYPDLNLTQVNQKVGKISENLMTQYFESSGWKRVEGEIGRNGIDGLFVQKDRAGTIRDVMIVESKYNTATLITTKNSGQQMSKTWALGAIDKLKQKYPSDNSYNQIERFINNDVHKARLWTLKATENEIKITLERVDSVLDEVTISPLKGGEHPKINYHNNNSVLIDNPTNEFQKNLVSWYDNEINNI